MKERISTLRRRLAAAARKRPGQGPGPRTAGGDARRASGAIAAVVIELAKIVREMLVIPAQLWMAIAELVGAAVLYAWRRALRPLIVALVALAIAAYRLAERHVTPARAVAAVCLAAIVALAASQWLDYRGISVGTDAYSGGIESVAPAPDVDRARAGDAHGWVMLPLALAGLVVLAVALAGRARAARLLALIGIAAIVVAITVDAPKGLDEGEAAVAYQGAEARLLEGFWAQIAAGAVLIPCGLLLPRYLRPASARATAPAPRGRRGAGAALARAGGKLRGRASGGGDRAARRKARVREART